MGTELISGVFFQEIPPIKTIGGSVLHAIKGTDKFLPNFGECYFSTAMQSVPKAWKKHNEMICNLFVPKGAVKFIFYDDRPKSEDFEKIVEFSLSNENYGRLIINPGIWFGFAGLAEGESIILNVSNIRHDPTESLWLEPVSEQIPYIWKF